MGSVLSSFSSPSPLSLPPASPSSPPPPPTSPQIKWDVFLSFRGEDTRDNFTSHLHKALVDKQIVTFIDDELNRGDEISPSLLKAIEESKIAIIIFSKDYASSRWCLKELVKILECRENHGQIVIPVFYQIDPSAVRKQKRSFEVAFAKHQSLEENSSEVQKWKDALNRASNISGFDSLRVRSESVLIEEIVQKVLEDLKRLNNVFPSGNEKRVGIESMIKDIELLLRTEDQIHNGVRIVGIWGIGGIGKTTLARAVYDKISCLFNGSYFAKRVKEKDPNRLRKKLYLKILRDKNAYKDQFSKMRLSRMKLLIILDDVTSLKQVNDLIGDRDCFGLGSRIIITSRDRQVLKNLTMNCIYEVKELSFDNALNLFCQHSFKQNCPKIGYMELSKRIVENVGGVPLALEVLGSSLFDREKEYWESSMKKLENFLDEGIYGVLRVSYDGLDIYQRNLFLDIACFYKGWDVNMVTAIMDARGFSPIKDLTDLVDKSLITIPHNQIRMHDLLQAMGKRIVQEESKNPGERTRLCNPNDVFDVLTQLEGTKEIEGISLDMSNTGDIYLDPNAFLRMRKLRFLQFYTSNYREDDNNKVHVLQDLNFFGAKLRYFEWYRCPLKSLQSNSHLQNLVILSLRHSNVEQLWSGVQQFDHLKKINLFGSKKLIRLPDLRAPKLEDLCLMKCTSLIEIPQLPKSLKVALLKECSKLQRLPELPNNLENLNLGDCSSLIEIPLSIQHLTSLNYLDLTRCESLTSIPNCTGLISLRSLVLCYCSTLKRLPDVPNNLLVLNLDGCSKLQRLPELPNNLKSLYLSKCSNLIEIPSSIQHLTSLYGLDLSYCSKLEGLLGIPNTLKKLELKGCSKLQRLPELPNSLEKVYLQGCSSLIEIPSSIQHLTSLEHLYLSNCESLTSIPDCTGLISLQVLRLSHCSKLERLPEIPNNLGVLYLEGCSILQRFPKLPNNLISLHLGQCSCLIEIPSSIQHLTRLNSLNLSNLESLTSIPDCTGLISLQDLTLSHCSKLERLPAIPNNLKTLHLRSCERLKVLPKHPWTHIDARDCTSLQQLSCPSFPNDFFALPWHKSLSASFINCFKLDRNSLDRFMEDAQWEIRAQSPSYRQVYKGKGPLLELCYPSNEIPEWFDFQNTGSFIDVKLPRDSIDCNFLCFVLCAVVSYPDQLELPNDCFTYLKYKCYVKSKEGGHNWDSMNRVAFFKSHFIADCHMSSSHVIIGFGFHFFRELHDNEFTFQFGGSKNRHKQACKVEKCGVHLIFGETVKNPKRMMKCILKNSIEEDEPNPKRLKHI